MIVHVDVGANEIVVAIDGRPVALPIGVVSLSSGLMTDPPRPEELTNAIATAHGGTLSLHDRQPHGLVVRIRLPVRQQSERAAA